MRTDIDKLATTRGRTLLLYRCVCTYYLAAGITNTEFICGKAEDVLPNLMWRLSGQEVVVVVDPPRAGLREFHFVSALLLFCVQYCRLNVDIIAFR